MSKNLALLISFTFLNWPANSLTSYESIEIVSDESWTVQGTNYMGKAVETWKHPQWTTIPGAKWIWKSYFVENLQGESYMFQKEFNIYGIPTQSSLSIAGDNAYTLILNGNFIVATQFWNEGRAQNYDLLSKTIQGRNVVQVVVTNYARENKNVYTNPAGLLFKLTVKSINI